MRELSQVHSLRVDIKSSPYMAKTRIIRYSELRKRRKIMIDTGLALDDEQLFYVVKHSPVVSIDLIIEDQKSRILVGLRNNEPAKGMYFVPGGMIRKGETRAQAFRRILIRETGLAIDFSTAQFINVFEHNYPTNRFNAPGFGTDYFALAYRMTLPDGAEVIADDQHSELAWMTPEMILASTDVHENTKAYCRL